MLSVWWQLLVVVVAQSVSESFHRRPAAAHADHRRDDQPVEPMMSDDVDGCYVVTIFGLKTADCGKHNARTVPTDLDSHLQVCVVSIARKVGAGAAARDKINVSRDRTPRPEVYDEHRIGQTGLVLATRVAGAENYDLEGDKVMQNSILPQQPQ